MEKDSQINAVTVAAKPFEKVLEALGQSRELSLAKTKLEEAVMWAVRHVDK